MNTCVFCNRPARPQRRACNTCRARQYDDPLRRKYRNLKASAKRRWKSFTLTFEHFAQVAIAGGYASDSGRAADSLSIDRINPWRGYEDGNIQVLTVSENICKRFADCPF